MSDIDNWIEKIGDKPIPVLPETIQDVTRLCKLDDIPVHKLTEVVERDPGLTVQILRTANLRKRSSLSTEVTSVNQALMMMGTEQLSRFPEQLPNLDETLDEKARVRLLKVFARAYHAGQQATDWAIQRRDMTPDEVFAAAELHFLAEMLFAIIAPEKLEEIDSLRQEKHIASHEAEYLVLGFSFNQFTRSLARKWQLPRLVIEALHDSNAQFPRAYGIMLAVQVAQGAFIDWHNPRTIDIFERVADWIGKEQDAVITHAHKLAVDIADSSQLYRVSPAAAFLPLLPAVKKQSPGQTADAIPDSDEEADICLSPQAELLKTGLQELAQMGRDHKALEIIAKTARVMHDGIGLNRVVFARLDKESQSLKGCVIVGSGNDPVFNRFTIKLDLPHLFSRLMEKPQAVLVNDLTRNKIWSLVPQEFARFIGTNSFAAMSVHFKDESLGLFYADRHTSSCQLEERSYQYFKKVTLQCSNILNTLNRIVLEETN